jgi:Holliday junction resolvase|tara:strand:+ start:129 stop:539 length:411 start_codon:yes stop_codon:yes gene_type:complete
MTNSRNKGAAFEREIANSLNEELNLTVPLKRILEQTREKFLPDLILGNWYLECKRYGQGNEPVEKWWSQVLDAAKDRGIPALIYKFNNRPIKVRVPLHTINNNLMKDDQLTCDLAWKEFIFILKTLYPEDIARHQK